MGIAGGPNLNQDGLVFLYDVFDQDNSYKGKPTTNYFTNGHFSGGNGIPQEGGSNATNTIIQLDNPGNSPWVLQQNGNFTEYQINLGAELAPSTTYVMSGWYAESLNFNGTTTMMHARAFSNSGAHNATGTDLGTVLYSRQVGSILWKYCYQTITTPADYSNNFNWYVGYGSPSHTGYRYYTNLQMELGSTPSQFVNGTRSATQGLLDVAGTNQIDISNVSFDANAQITFDGTNDYINIGNYLTSLDTSILSIEIVFKTNVLSGNLMLLGWHENEYPHGYICLGNFTGYWANETISFYNEGPGTTPLSFAYTNGDGFLSDTLYHHVVFILKTNEYKIYVDGKEVTVNASFRNGAQNTVMPSNLFGYGATPSVILGAGSDPAGSFFNGVIPITKIYNRALTATEVLQNYNATKSRFNLK